MSYASSTVTYTPAPAPAGSRWTLTGTRPGRLALRLVLAAAAVGGVGGAVTGLLTMLFGVADGSAARQVAIWMPVALFAMIVWRLVAGLAGAGRGPSNGGIVLTAAWLLFISAVIVGLPKFGEFAEDLTHNAGVGMLGAFVGAEVGLVVAAAAAVVLVPALLLSRAVGVQVPLAGAQVLLTVFVVAVTGLLSLVPSEFDIPALSAMALAGVGAVLTSRWVLVDRVLVDRAA